MAPSFQDPIVLCPDPALEAELLVEEFAPPAARPSIAFGRVTAVLATIAVMAGCAGKQRGNEVGNEPDMSVRRLHGHTGPVHNLRFTPDGRLVSGSGWPESDQTLQVWDAATGQRLKRIPTPGSIHSLDIAADGRVALVGLNNGTVLHVDLEAGQIVRALKIHGAEVGWVAFAPDGKHAFSTSDEGTARMWDLADGNELMRVRVRSKQARGGVLLPDGLRLLTGDSQGSLQIWDVATGHEIKEIRMGGAWMIDAVGLSPDGRQALVACGAGVCVHDLETGQEVRRFQERDEEVHQAAVSPDGRWLLAGSMDGVVRLWDYASGKLIRVLGSHNGFVFSVAFSPDGRFAASGGGGENKGGRLVAGTDHDIRLWDLSRLKADAPATSPFAKHGWLTTTGIVVFAIVVFVGLAAGAAFCRRQRRAAAQTPAANQPATTEVAAAFVAVACGGCGKMLKAKAAWAGKKVKCPQCGKSTAIPESRPSACPAAPPRAARRFAPVTRWWYLGVLPLIPAALIGGWLLRPVQPERRSWLDVTLGNQCVANVEESGFYGQEFDQHGLPFRWTDGNARLVIPIDKNKRPRAVYLELHIFRPPQVAGRVRILANQQELCRQDIVPHWKWQKTLDLHGLDMGEELVLEILSDTFVPLGVMDGGANTDPRTLGVQVRCVKLLAAIDPANEPAAAEPEDRD